MRVAVAALIGLVSIAHSALAQQAAPKLDTTRGLLIRYADGRMHTRPLRPRGSMFTSQFPKIPGATPAYEKLPLSVIDIRHVVEGADVLVTVSLGYAAGPKKHQVQVATVRVSPGVTIDVNELRGYGVEPISLSIVSIPNTPSTVPEIVSSSPLLDLYAEQYGPNASSYAIVLTNRSEKALMALRFTGYRDGKTFTGGQAGPRSTPLVAAKSQDVFEIAMGPTGFVPGSEPHAWSPIDRIEITSLLWQDGTFEGERTVAVQMAKAATQRAAELGAMVTALADSRGNLAAGVRARIASLTVVSSDVRESRDGFLAQLDARANGASTRDAFDAWLDESIKFYQAWLDRIVVPRVDR